MPTATFLPLRERKRIATWDTLHEAAASLALKHDSLHTVTIDAIVDQANVSPRTFFNYFDTKEDAILGFSEPAVSPATLECFANSSAALVERVANFYFDVMASSRTSGRERRAQIIARHPELSNRQVTHFAHVERLVHEFAVEHLADVPRPEAISDLNAFVDALVFTSSAAYRIATRRTATCSTDSGERAAMHTALIQLREVSRQIL